MEGGGEGGQERAADSKDLQQQSKALDKLTDRVEDRQLDSTRVQEVCSYPFIPFSTSGRCSWAGLDLLFVFFGLRPSFPLPIFPI